MRQASPPPCAHAGSGAAAVGGRAVRDGGGDARLRATTRLRKAGSGRGCSARDARVRGAEGSGLLRLPPSGDRRTRCVITIFCWHHVYLKIRRVGTKTLTGNKKMQRIEEEEDANIFVNHLIVLKKK